MNQLYKFYWDCGRNGEVKCVFVSTDEEIVENIGKQVYFGEILGKHSEIFGTLDEKDLEKIDLDEETINKVSAILGSTWSGHNPLLHISE